MTRRRSLDIGGPAPLLGFVVGLDRLSWRPSAVRLVDAVSKAAEAQNAGLLLTVDAEKPSEVLRSLIGDGQIAGVLIRAQAADQQWVRELASSVPMVMIGLHRALPDVHVVEIENVESTAALVGSMFDAGCRRLAMVAGAPGRVDSDDRLEGFRLAHVQRGWVCDSSLIFPGNFSRRGGYAIADAVLDAQPDGIFAASDETANGIIERAAERGIQVPRDVVVAGFDGTGHAAMTDVELPSVRPPWDDLAGIAVETLLGLAGGMDMPRVRLVDPQVRPVTGTAPHAGTAEPIDVRASVSRAVLEGLA